MPRMRYCVPMSKVEEANETPATKRRGSAREFFMLRRRIIRAIIKQTPGPMPPMRRRWMRPGVCGWLSLELYFDVRANPGNRTGLGGTRMLQRVPDPEPRERPFQPHVFGMLV